MVMMMMKVEKSSAGPGRYRKLQRAFTLLRCLELAVFLLLALRALPAAARASGDFLRLSASVLVSPRFLFLLGNAIVIHLFLNKCSSSTSSVDEGTTIISSFIPPLPARCEGKEHVVYEDKEVVVSKTSRAFRRTRSEKMHVIRRRRDQPPELRRSSTDVDEKVTSAGGEEDAEEFRRTIEAFIEKQQLKFQREETTNTNKVAASPEVVEEKE